MKITKSELKEMIKEELLKEDDYATKYIDMIDDIKNDVLSKSTAIVKMLNKQDKMTGTKNAKSYNQLFDKYFKKFIAASFKIQSKIKD